MTVAAPLTPRRLYLRIFVRMAVPFGIGMAAWLICAELIWPGRVPFEHKLPFILIGCVLAGVFYGACMSAVLGTVAIRAARGRSTEALEVRQQRVLHVACSPEELLSTLCAALASLPRARTPRSDATSTSVETVVGMSWKSWGEVVTARVEGRSAAGYKVKVESRPRVRATIVDYGRNYENVEAVAQALKERPT